MEDEFVDIIGYEGLYEINRNGEIIGSRYKKKLKGEIDLDGYKRFNLSKDKKRNHIKLHRLLAIQFIPNPDNLPCVDHIDRDRLNNNLSNLRWCDYETNTRNSKNVINRQGCIQIRKLCGKDYFVARFQKDYNKEITKSSYNINEVEEWLIEMRNEYARNEIYV
jgi:hypothetical protein